MRRYDKDHREGQPIRNGMRSLGQYVFDQPALLSIPLIFGGVLVGIAGFIGLLVLCGLDLSEHYPPDGQVGYYTSHLRYLGPNNYQNEHTWHPVVLPPATPDSAAPPYRDVYP